MKLFLTDFIKNSSIQWITILGMILDIITSHSINHILVLFGFPYLISVILPYIMSTRTIKVKARISAQYKPRQK